MLCYGLLQFRSKKLRESNSESGGDLLGAVRSFIGLGLGDKNIISNEASGMKLKEDFSDLYVFQSPHVYFR